MAAAVPKYGKGLVGLVRRGFHEIPEIMLSMGLGFVGVGLGLAGVIRYNRNDGDNKRYKGSYIIMRSNDPRVAKVHKD